MICPHCSINFHAHPRSTTTGDHNEDKDGCWFVETHHCPACNRFILTLVCSRRDSKRPVEVHRILAYPKQAVRKPLSPDVPNALASDFREAALVLSDSPKASAALSRRCLQHILRTAAGVKHQDLAKEIQEVLDSGKLPSHLSDCIDAIRNIGNFAAHPIKGSNPGEILDVEPGEAEWLLDTLEGLFDFYFVQPAETQRKRAALNTKLTAAGKPTLK